MTYDSNTALFSLRTSRGKNCTSSVRLFYIADSWWAYRLQILAGLAMGVYEIWVGLAHPRQCLKPTLLGVAKVYSMCA